MDDYSLSLGVPDTTSVGGIRDKNYKNPQQEQKKKKKKEKKPSVLPKKDEVILSGNVQAPRENENEPKNENESDSPEENQEPPHPGDNIDIKI